MAQLLLLFGRHRLQHVPLTAGDRELYEAYSDALRARNLVDYDDLIARTGELLRTRADVRLDVRARWDYVLVDEFQDLSLAQYEVVTELAARHRNCFAVGDDEQSIFSWTGADPAILGRFRDDFGIAEPDHPRPEPALLAPDLRDRAPAGHPQSRPVREAARGRPASRTTASRRTAFADESCEAEWVVADLLHDQAASRPRWGDYGVLYRSHRIGQQLETRFIEAGIPCLMARGQALLDDELIGVIVASLARSSRRPMTRSRSRRSPSGCCRRRWSSASAPCTATSTCSRASAYSPGRCAETPTHATRGGSCSTSRTWPG